MHDIDADAPRSPEQATVYEVVHTTVYSYSEAVPVCHNEVHLRPRDTAGQEVMFHALAVDPPPATTASRIDWFGNHVSMFTIGQVHLRLAVTSTSRVAVATPTRWGSLPSSPWEAVRDRAAVSTAAIEFVGVSPFVRTLPQLAEYARVSFQPGRPWAEAVVDLTRRIHREFVYDPTATTTSTPVEDVFTLRRGVCQDFAHLQIACLRSLRLPARYVSGYLCNTAPRAATPASPAAPLLVGADASHAWVSAWGGDAGWLDVDPTNDCVVGDRHVTVAWGRDYGDVCPIRGVFVGGGQHGMDVAVHVTRSQP
jgi:transglutaminase-like putative cysteine protease